MEPPHTKGLINTTLARAHPPTHILKYAYRTVRVRVIVQYIIEEHCGNWKREKRSTKSRAPKGRARARSILLIHWVSSGSGYYLHSPCIYIFNHFVGLVCRLYFCDCGYYYSCNTDGSRHSHSVLTRTAHFCLYSHVCTFRTFALTAFFLSSRWLSFCSPICILHSCLFLCFGSRFFPLSLFC